MSLPPDIAYTRLFDGITGFLRRISLQRPLVLVLDDIHMASSSSLALLQTVVSDLSDCRLMFVTAYRGMNEQETPAVSSVLQKLRTLGALELQLTGLDDSEVRNLISAVASAPVEPGLIEKIVADTDGNPFFVLEILRSLEGRGGRLTGSTYRLPASVSRALNDRLQNLAPATRGLLSAAAVCGSDFDAYVAAAAAGLDRNSTIAAVSQSLEAGLVVESAGVGRMHFSHELLREKLLQDLPKVAQADLHDAIGAALERAGRGEDDAAQLAYHYSRSSSVAGQRKAIDYCLIAGKHELDHYSNSEACEFLERARELAECHGAAANPAYCQILEGLAEVYVRLGNVAAADDAAARLHTAARALGNPSWLARAAIAVSPRTYLPTRSSRTEGSIAALSEALSVLPAEPSMLRARVAVRLAVTLLRHHGGDERRIVLAGEAIEIARLTVSSESATIFDEAIIALWDADHRDERLALAQHIEAVGGMLGNRYFECLGLSWIALDRFGRGRLSEADAVTTRAEKAVYELGLTAAERYLRRLRIQGAILRGELERAEQMIEQYQSLRAPTNPVAGQLEWMFLKASLDRERGQLGDFGPTLQAISSNVLIPGLHYAIPYFLIQADRTEEARIELERVAVDLSDQPPRNEACAWLTAMAMLGDAVVDLNDRRRAAALYRMLQPFEDHWVVVFFASWVYGSVGRVLGRLAALNRSFERADEHFERVMQVCEREGAVTELRRAKLDYAAAIGRRRHRPHDPNQLRAEAAILAAQYHLSPNPRTAGTPT